MLSESYCGASGKARPHPGYVNAQSLYSRIAMAQLNTTLFRPLRGWPGLCDPRGSREAGEARSTHRIPDIFSLFFVNWAAVPRDSRSLLPADKPTWAPL